METNSLSISSSLLSRFLRTSGAAEVGATVGFDGAVVGLIEGVTVGFIDGAVEVGTIVGFEGAAEGLAEGTRVYVG